MTVLIKGAPQHLAAGRNRSKHHPVRVQQHVLSLFRTGWALMLHSGSKANSGGRTLTLPWQVHGKPSCRGPSFAHPKGPFVFVRLNTALLYRCLQSPQACAARYQCKARY